MSTVPSLFQVPKDSEKDHLKKALVSKINTFWFKVTETPIQTGPINSSHQAQAGLNRRAIIYVSLSLLLTFGLAYLAWTRRMKPIVAYPGAAISLIPALKYIHRQLEHRTSNAETTHSSKVEIYDHIKRFSAHPSKPLPLAMAMLSTAQEDIDVFSTFCSRLDPKQTQLRSLPPNTALTGLDLQGDWVAVFAKRELWKPSWELHYYSNVAYTTDPTTHPSLVLTALPDQKAKPITVFSRDGEVTPVLSTDDAIWHSFCLYGKTIKVSFNLAPVHEPVSDVFFNPFSRMKEINARGKKLAEDARKSGLEISRSIQQLLNDGGDQSEKSEGDEADL